MEFELMVSCTSIIEKSAMAVLTVRGMVTVKPTSLLVGFFLHILIASS
jgi:hypothetical protein